jgi:hypothetical protein
MTKPVDIQRFDSGAADTTAVDNAVGHAWADGPPGVSVAELQRAWRAVQGGQFRTASRGPVGRAQQEQPFAAWTPGTGERVLPVVSCTGSCGATTAAVALGEAAKQRARVVECGSATTSGLAAASNAELGLHASGWLQGTRGELLLERAHDVLIDPVNAPVPSTPDRPVALTILDVAWELGQLLASPCWLTAQIINANPIVLIATCTVPGMRRLESTLALLGDMPRIAAVVGPPRRRWPSTVQHGTGSLTRTLDHAGRLLSIPVDRRLAVTGLDSTPLPASLLDAATELLYLTAEHLPKGTAS